jgi:hypothetical protein
MSAGRCKWVVCGVLEGVFRRMPRVPRRGRGREGGSAEGLLGLVDG